MSIYIRTHSIRNRSTLTRSRIPEGGSQEEMNKEVTVEACEEFIRSTFEKIAKACRCDIGKAGIEVGVFWDEAEKAGLWERGTYGTPMSDALSKLAKVEARLNKEGEWRYSVFMMKKGG